MNGETNYLDQPETWSTIDPKSMRSLLEDFPEQVAAGVRAAESVPLQVPGDIRAVVVTGLGGSAIGGDLARAIGEPDLRCPMAVNRTYGLPGFVDASTLVLACSYSGNTEETLSAYEQARRAGARILCITSGGKLEARAKQEGHTVLSLPGGLPPRAALGHSLVALLAALQAAGVLPDLSGSFRETIGMLRGLRGRYRAETPAALNPAKRIAGSLAGKIAAVYGSAGILEAAAYRWRSQIAENAKNLASHHALPEMNHNELVGWVHPGDVLRHVGVVLLRDRLDHPQIQRRFELTREILTKKAGSLQEVWSEGESALARVLSVIYLGDYVSLYLAFLNKVDPTPVSAIDTLKRFLGKPV